MRPRQGGKQARDIVNVAPPPDEVTLRLMTWDGERFGAVATGLFFSRLRPGSAAPLS